MTLRVTLSVLGIVLGGLAGPVAAETAKPALHEEAGRAWSDVADQLRSFRAQVERHFRVGPGGALPGVPWPASPSERPLISFMLDHRADLGLSAEQASRLETLRADFTREAIRRDAEIRIAEMDLAALLDQDPLDLAKTEAKLREVAQLQADLRIARLRTIEQGKATLSSEQRSRLQGLLGGGRSSRRAAEGPRL